MKKVTVLALALLFAGVVACGGNTEAVEETVEVVEEAPVMEEAPATEVVDSTAADSTAASTEEAM